MQGGLAASAGSEAARDELTARRAAGEVALRLRLEKARADGELPADADPADLARYFITVYQGVAVQAAGGATREELHRVVDLAMGAWPAGPAAG